MVRATELERIESIKAGGMAALTGVIAETLLLVVERRISPPPVLPLPPGDVVRIVVAIICAFLFGVTYRYIVRQDQNPHLKSGAVGAFALTRSLSQLESGPLAALGSGPIAVLTPDWGQVLPLILPIFESFGFFLVLRWVLDWCLNRRWIEPFATMPQSDP